MQGLRTQELWIEEDFILVFTFVGLYARSNTYAYLRSPPRRLNFQSLSDSPIDAFVELSIRNNRPGYFRGSGTWMTGRARVEGVAEDVAVKMSLG